MKETTTTRVCIKNIPTSLDEDALKKFILKESSSDTNLKITDCKILRRKSDQQSRKIGFVGFATTSQASYVVSRFHRTYCYTSKLSVEHAIPRNNTKNNNTNNEHRPWSKYSKGSSQYERIHNKKNDKKENDKKEEEEEKKRKERELKKKKEEGDKKKEEFLAAMGIGKSKSRIWENDLGIEQQQEEEQQQNDKQPLQTTIPTDDDENSESDENSIVSNDSTDSEGAGADVLKSSSSNNKNKAVVGSVLTDLDFLKSKTSTKDDLESDDDDDQTATETKDDDSTSSDDSSSSSSSDTSGSSSSSDTEEELRDDNAKNNDDLNNSKVLDNNEDNQKRKEMDNKNNEGSSSNGNDESMMEADDKNEENDAMASNRLFVRNLPFSTTEEELREYMVTYAGNVTECHIPIDDMGRNKGYAFVSFDTADTAYQIKEELDGTDFQGRLLHILPARKNTNLEKENMNLDDPTLTYKQKQELIRQKEAQNKKGWSASFVRGDAVVDTLAERLGLRKGDILNVKGNLSSGDAAVRLALGETHVIEENRKYFKDHGINMEALVSVVSKKKKKGDDNDNDDDGSIKRSSNSILVKNLPFDTEKEDLIKLFGSIPGGNDPTKILLPPSRTIAYVKYEHNIDAKRAFKKLAYKRYKAVPLYLEWAPSAAATNNNEKKEDNKKVDEENKNIEEEEEEETTEGSNVSSFSIYIKNLNFSTTENRLREFFEKHVTVRAVKIPLKVEARRSTSTNNESSSDNTKKLSMGFGFVECDSDASVRKALSTLQGTVLDGHALDLKRSTKNLGGTTKKKSNTIPKGKNPTKIMCRNVPFQATRKELLQLFGSYGQLKKVRLPKKYDGGHRGFAFVEFLTSNEALSAMNALSRTHLYGRHLVLEWATDMDDIDTLREKSKRDLKIDIHSSSTNKRTKFN